MSRGGGRAPGARFTAFTLLGVAAALATSTRPADAQEDFSLSVLPASISLAPGQGTTVSVSAMGTGGFSGAISVSADGPAHLTVQPAAFTLAAGGSQSVTVTASASAAPGTASVVFSGSATGREPRTATLSVTVAANGPAIHAITPSALVTGTTGNLLRVSGDNFVPGTAITSLSPAVLVTDVRVLGPRAAEVMVAVRPDARPGSYQLQVQNPDGRVGTGAAALRVHPAGSLGAPLAVTGVEVVAPRPWQTVGRDERVHARALLATSGMGTVVVTWRVDGVPFDRVTRVVTGGLPVEVRSTVPIPFSSTGEHVLELVVESPHSVPPRRVPFLQATESRTALRILEPEPGAAVEAGAALFRWTLVPGATGYEVEIESLGADAAVGATAESAAGRSAPNRVGVQPWTTTRRRITDTRWRPDAALLRTLGPGEARVRVRAVFPGEVFGEPTAWQSVTLASGGGVALAADSGGAAIGDGSGGEIGDGSSAAGEGAPYRLASAGTADGPAAASFPDRPATRAAEGTGSRGEIALAFQGSTATYAERGDGPPSVTRFQLSTQADVDGSGFDLQATADLSASHDLGDPWRGREESRNWLARLGATQGGFRQEATIGFSPPSFFDQAELLTALTSAGGVLGMLGSPAGRLSYFRSLDLSGNGSFSGFEPRMDAAAYELGDQGGRFLFRTTAMRVDDPGVDDFSAGGEGRAIGVIGVADLGPRLRLLGEVAAGEFEPGEGSFEEERDGRAFRVSASGSAGTWGYGLVVGRTGEGFVNPANRGFTPGGLSGRTRAEATLQKSFGGASVSGGYNHVRGGIAEAAGDPRTTQNGGNLFLSVPLSERVSASVGGNLAVQRGDEVEEFGLPATDRIQRGVDVSVTEMLGPVVLSQSLSWQSFDDRVSPTSDQTVTGVNLAASGSPTAFLALSASVASTRISADPEVGNTTQHMLSLQPSLTVERLWLHLSPRVAYGRADNKLQETEFRTEQYQVVARWTPDWTRGLITLEAAGDWFRNRSHLDLEPPGFEKRHTLSLIFNWGADRRWAWGGQPDPAWPAGAHGAALAAASADDRRF